MNKHIMHVSVRETMLMASYVTANMSPSLQRLHCIAVTHSWRLKIAHQSHDLSVLSLLPTEPLFLSPPVVRLSLVSQTDSGELEEESSVWREMER